MSTPDNDRETGPYFLAACACSSNASAARSESTLPCRDRLFGWTTLCPALRNRPGVLRSWTGGCSRPAARESSPGHSTQSDWKAWQAPHRAWCVRSHGMLAYPAWAAPSPTVQALPMPGPPACPADGPCGRSPTTCCRPIKPKANPCASHHQPAWRPLPMRIRRRCKPSHNIAAAASSTSGLQQ